jgi:hypothetical protein
MTNTTTRTVSEINFSRLLARCEKQARSITVPAAITTEPPSSSTLALVGLKSRATALWLQLQALENLYSTVKASGVADRTYLGEKLTNKIAQFSSVVASSAAAPSSSETATISSSTSNSKALIGSDDDQQPQQHYYYYNFHRVDQSICTLTKEQILEYRSRLQALDALINEQVRLHNIATCNDASISDSTTTTTMIPLALPLSTEAMPSSSKPFLNVSSTAAEGVHNDTDDSTPLEELIQSHRQHQEDLAAEILRTTQRLKETSRLACELIRQDVQKIERVGNAADDNIALVQSERERLAAQAKADSMCSMVLSILTFVVIAVFMAMYAMMRVTSSMFWR